MFKKNLRIFLICILIFISIGLFWIFRWNETEITTSFDKPAQLIQTVDTDVTVIIDFGNGALRKFQDITLRANETAFQLLKRIAESEDVIFEYQEYSDLGAMITRLGSKENGKDGAYWQYWVNGKYAELGASSYKLQSRDIIEWKFVK